jgi:tetratricopeptide (TPR) repeat protein
MADSFNVKALRYIHGALAGAVLLYAALAACYTLKNFDLGWQLAAGRYIAETGHIPRLDVFSYTAPGKEWVYPAGAELLFYALYRLAGYIALTLLGMAACVSAVALVFFAEAGNSPSRHLTPDTWRRSPGAWRLWLVALAVPAIADRTGARADMFTTVLFAAVLVIVWRFHRQLRSPLHLLPLLFLLWANLHQGFIFGLALLAAACAATVWNSWVGGRSLTVAARLPHRQLYLWSALSALAVLINPWGWRLYASLWRVRQDMAFQRGFIGEASAVPWGWWRLRDAVRLHDPDAGLWLLLALALAGIAVALLRRQWLPAVLLTGACWLGVHYVRAQALSAIVAALVLPSTFGFAGRQPSRDREGAARSLTLAALLFALALLPLLALRSADLASNRYYIARGDIATFGFGPSWWFPERALDFIGRERLPGRIYHDYNLGGWMMWRLWPRYQVFIDGRAQPFTPNILLEQHAMRAASIDSPAWREFLDRWGINTVLISLARYGGYRLSPAELCASPDFRLVYIDEVSGVWLRARPENRAWLDRLARPCPPASLPAAGASLAARYNFLANAGQLYHAFGMDAEALKAYRDAETIFGGDANLRFSIAQVWDSRGRTAEARQEYRNALALGESSQAWHALGLLEWREGRYREAAEAFAGAAQRAVLAHESCRMLGEAFLALREPKRALEAFQRARAASRYRQDSAGLAAGWLALVEDGERRARAMTHDK